MFVCYLNEIGDMSLLYFDVASTGISYCYRHVSQMHVECRNAARIGNKSDGGWDICLSPPFQLVQPCLVYSFGYVSFVES